MVRVHAEGMSNQVLIVERLSKSEQRELHDLAGRARCLYDGFLALPVGDFEHRRDVWSEIVAIQDSITVLLAPAVESR